MRITDGQMTEAKDERPLTIKELAGETGYSVSTLRRRVKDGSIPVIQPGGRGKKMTFLPTVINELVAKRTAERNDTAYEEESSSQHTGQCPLRPLAEGVAENQLSEADNTALKLVGVKRPVVGPIPSWMLSPLLSNIKSKQDISKK